MYSVNCILLSLPSLFGAAIEQQPVLKIKWKTNNPVWVDQWPLTAERLQKVNELVEEQLQAGHIQPSTSPWNTLIFTIPKKSGEWHLLHDSRAVNNVMEDMGALQPGLPSLVLIPEKWTVLVIDLKDCFFTIPLHPEDAERFAFSVPSINKAEPACRFHWIVLPQGMKNSPTTCQIFVAWALQPIRKKMPQLLIYRYMDDILIAGKDMNREFVLQKIVREVEFRGLKIAPEKTQKQEPWNYLGWIILQGTIKAPKIQLNPEIKTLNDVQKLVGDIQWVRALCGITSDDLAPLVELLGTTSRADDRRTMGPRQKQALEVIQNKIISSHASRIRSEQPLTLMLINSAHTHQHPFPILMQWVPGENPLRILEWIFLSIRPKKTVTTRIELLSQLIIQGRNRCVEIAGCEPQTILVPLMQEYMEWLIRTSIEFQIVISNFPGTVDDNYPSHKLMPLLSGMIFEEWPIQSNIPLEGITVFTDAGKSSKKAACTWERPPGIRHHQVIEGDLQDSLQTLELKAVVWALAQWNMQPVNIVSDSLYVVGVGTRLERAMLKEVSNRHLYRMLQQLLFMLNNRTVPYFITHIRSHLMTGGLAEGNRRADQLVMPTWTGPPTDSFAQVRNSHEFFHQSAKVLMRQFRFPMHDAQGIVKSCPDCQNISPGLGVGVNPKGLRSLQLWQMDVTHVPEFGRQKYVLVVIDTFSIAFWATAQSGETTQHVTKHLYASFAVLGIPTEIKADSGPAYTSTKSAQFCVLWGIHHTTRIPNMSHRTSHDRKSTPHIETIIA